MTLVLTGAAGQLAGDLSTRWPNAIGLTRAELDLSNADDVHRVLGELRPDVVVNCAAYNLVDQAESEPDVAYRVNGLGPRAMAQWCSEHGAYLLHVSTDYVFGRDTAREQPFSEDDPIGPLSAYGVSKLAGEQFVLADHPGHAVVRTCGLYGHHGGNFVKTMLRLSETRDELNVVADQHCTPTATSDLADWIVQLVEQRAGGLFHATNASQTTWAEFAAAIFEAAGRSVTVHPITSAEFGAAATRPPYSVLRCDRLDAVLSKPRRDWRTAVTEFVSETLNGHVSSVSTR